MSNPTDPKLSESDLLNLAPFARRLESYISVEKDYVDGSLVVTLDAPFGSGKSTFLEMWKDSLTKKREEGEFVPMPITLNAWESDFCGDPLVAILSGLLGAVDQWKGPAKPDKSKLKEAAKDAAWFAVGLANGFIASTTGIDALDASELTGQKKADRAKKIPDFIEIHEKRTQAMEDLRSQLEESFGGIELKVVVFVDELDRCRPDYAVSYLETIKHVFNIKGMAFVLAIDYNQLSSSTKALYGNSMKFEDYFRKFSHRTIRLPDPDANTFNSFIHQYVNRYVAIEGKRMSALPHNGLRTSICLLAKAFRLNPRQLQEAFRVMGHVSEVQNSNSSGQLMWNLANATILLCIIRSGDFELYEKIKDETLSHDEIAAELKRRLGKNDAQFWIAIFLSGVWPLETDLNEWIASRRECLAYDEKELNELTDTNFRNCLAGWGYNFRTATRIHGIIHSIENVDKFENS